MNLPDISEFKLKENRIQRFFEDSGYEALIIGRQDNFSWLACGGSSRITHTSEAGSTILIVLKNRKHAIFQRMDAQRMLDEELTGLDFEPVSLFWYEESKEEKAAQIVKGLKTISDIMITGTDYLPGIFVEKFHFPLFDSEMIRYRTFCREFEEAVIEAADQANPGMTEHEVYTLVAHECLKRELEIVTLLIGSDERVSQYTHFCDTHKRIDRLLLLAPGVRKWGLNASMTRTVFFGDRAPEELLKKYQDACSLKSAILSLYYPGKYFADILSEMKSIYEKAGYADSWGNHYKGGPAGYTDDIVLFTNRSDVTISANQAYVWLIALNGAKVEETSLCTSSGAEILTLCGGWPSGSYEYGNKEFNLPGMLFK